jgi:hypothetical protein
MGVKVKPERNYRGASHLAVMWGLARLGFRITAFEFQENEPEQQVIPDASNEGNFGNPADKRRRVASLRRQAEPVSQFRVGLVRIHRLC